MAQGAVSALALWKISRYSKIVGELDAGPPAAPLEQLDLYAGQNDSIMALL
jgi:hypothetical protein